MRIAIMFIAVVSLSACEVNLSDSPVGQVHHYEHVGTFKFQTLANEETVYEVALELAPLAGYKLETDMREKEPEDGISFGGLHFRKDRRKKLLTFSPTGGINCYFISVSAYDNEVATKARSDLHLLQEELKRMMGAELLYLGAEGCPDITLLPDAQQSIQRDGSAAR